MRDYTCCHLVDPENFCGFCDYNKRGLLALRASDGPEQVDEKQPSFRITVRNDGDLMLNITVPGNLPIVYICKNVTFVADLIRSTLGPYRKTQA